MKVTKKQLEALENCHRIPTGKDLSLPPNERLEPFFRPHIDARVKVSEKLKKPITGMWTHQERGVMTFDLCLVDGEVYLQGIGNDYKLFGRHEPELGRGAKGEKDVWPKAEALAKELQRGADELGWGDPPSRAEVEFEKIDRKVRSLYRAHKLVSDTISVIESSDLPPEILQHAEATQDALNEFVRRQIKRKAEIREI